MSIFARYLGNASAPGPVITLPLPIAEGGTGQTTSNTAFNALAPSQTSNSGKFLTTNGTSTSWATLTASPLTTKGDVWGYSTVNARIPVGTNGQVLTADSTQTLGLKWATPSGGGITLSAVGSAPNANAATLTGSALNLEPADATHPGVVTAIAQAFDGVKTFGSQVRVPSGSAGTPSVAFNSAFGDGPYLTGLYLQATNGDFDKLHIAIDGGDGGWFTGNGNASSLQINSVFSANGSALKIGNNSTDYMLFSNVMNMHMHIADASVGPNAYNLGSDASNTYPLKYLFSKGIGLGYGSVAIPTLAQGEIRVATGTNMTLTADKVLCSAGIGVGNSAPAIVAVGALANKMEVFNASGVSLGFVPIYASIT